MIRILVLSGLSFLFSGLKTPDVFLYTPANIYSGSNCKNHLIIASFEVNLSRSSNFNLFGFEIDNATSPEIFVNGKQIDPTDTVEICDQLKVEIKCRQIESGNAVLKFHSDVPGQESKQVIFDRTELYVSNLSHQELVIINQSFNCTENLKLNFTQRIQAFSSNSSQAHIYKRNKLVKTLNISRDGEKDYTFKRNSEGLYKVIYRTRWRTEEFAIIFR